MSDVIGQHEGLNIYDHAPDPNAVLRRLKRDRVTAEIFFCLSRRSSYAGKPYWVREMCYKRTDGDYQIVHGNRAGHVVIAWYSYFAEGCDRHVVLGPVGSQEREAG